MTFEISCNDLGAGACNMGFRGKTTRDVVERCVWHLQATHHVAMPGIDQVIEGKLQSIEDADVRRRNATSRAVGFG